MAVVGFHAFEGLHDVVGGFLGGVGDLAGGLDRSGVELSGEVGLDLLEFVDRFGEFGSDGANFFIYVRVLFFAFVHPGLANGFKVALHFGQVFFPVSEAGIGNGTEVIDPFGEGGLDVFVVFELVGEVFEGIAWFIRFGGDAGELLDRFPKFLDGFIDEGLDFFEVGGHFPSFLGGILGMEGKSEQGD